jgi:hypothetical protein
LTEIQKTFQTLHALRSGRQVNSVLEHRPFQLNTVPLVKLRSARQCGSQEVKKSEVKKSEVKKSEVKKSEVGSRKSEVRSQKSEVGSRKSEVSVAAKDF